MTSAIPPPDDPEIARLIIANAREYGIITFDEKGLITSWSPGAELIFGYAPAEIIGKPGSELFVSSDVAAGAHEQEFATARAAGRAEDSRWHERKNGERFWGNGVLMTVADGPYAGFLKILRDETASKLADEQRVLLLNELNHRIKNTLATVQSIAEHTLRSANIDADVRRDLTGRLMALSEAHDLLVAENWAGAELENIVAQAAEPFELSTDNRFRAEGPPVRLSPQQAVSLSLALHELATNAAKYGALSIEGGQITVSWNVAQDGAGRRFMNLLWTESGGPRVLPPQRTGFGSRLIARTVGQENGHARVEYRPDGVRCVIEMELSHANEIPMLDVAKAARKTQPKAV